MSELIVLQHPNGYFGSLTVGKSMTVTKDGKEVLHTCSPVLSNADDLWEFLGMMPEIFKGGQEHE